MSKKSKTQLLKVEVYIDSSGYLHTEINTLPRKDWIAELQGSDEPTREELSFYTDLINVMWDIAHDSQKKLGRFTQ